MTGERNLQLPVVDIKEIVARYSYPMELAVQNGLEIVNHMAEIR